MLDNETAELIITADGILKNYVFVEELIDSVPKIKGWKFTAHKPAANEGFKYGRHDSQSVANQITK